MFLEIKIFEVMQSYLWHNCRMEILPKMLFSSKLDPFYVWFIMTQNFPISFQDKLFYLLIFKYAAKGSDPLKDE